MCRTFTLVAAVAALAGSGMLASAPGASAGVTGTCGQSFSPVTTGGRARWTLSCSGGRITMSGWVEDTKPDGECAYVKGIFSSTITEVSRGACPEGDRENFSWTHTGSLANGYLYVS
jgi:hypothetical protein